MKGQLEIFGLAIVFVLVLLALLLYLRFGGTSEEQSEDFYYKQLPGRILNSMKEVTTPCKDQKLEALMIDVADNVDISEDEMCGDLNLEKQISCIGTNSYGVLSNSIDSILEQTLEESFINYDFKIKFIDGCTIYKKSFNVNENIEGCERARKVDASTLTFATDNGKVDMMLRIC